MAKLQPTSLSSEAQYSYMSYLTSTPGCSWMTLTLMKRPSQRYGSSLFALRVQCREKVLPLNPPTTPSGAEPTAKTPNDHCSLLVFPPYVLSALPYPMTPHSTPLLLSSPTPLQSHQLVDAVVLSHAPNTMRTT